MNLAELIAEVYLVTNRPDMVNETLSAVRSATLKAHQTDFYSKDIYETGVEFTESNYIQSLDYISLVSNYRALKYLRRVQDEHDQNGVFFTIVTPEEILDSYGRTRANIGYVAGRSLELHSSVPFTKCLLGCYVNPIVSVENYSSWVAEQFPYAIVHDAARKIFMATGQLDEASGQTRLLAEEYQALRSQSLTDVGY